MNNNSQPCKVLFVMAGMEIGGVQSGVMNFARIISPERVQFDVLVLDSSIGFHEEEFKKYGRVFHMSILKIHGRISCVFSLLLNNLLLRIKLKNFFSEHHYDAVHCKVLRYCAVVSEAARSANVPVRVTQAHVDKPVKQHFFFEWYYKWCSKRIEKAATDKLAVSPGAVEYLYGRFGGNVIKNPTISLKRLNPKNYPSNLHDEIRLLQIGTFSTRKNQCFSVEVLNILLSKKMTAKLYFVGYSLDEPNYINEIHSIIEKYNLSNNVVFYPKDTDVPKLLSQVDYMLLPSLSEGLPNVALEAQAMGVPVFLTDKVNKNTNCGLCVFLPLDKGAEQWADCILDYRRTHGTDKRYVDMSGWDNERIAEQYIDIWTKQINQ